MEILKGLIIGATMIVPGVSGGSMAMVLGIYDRLISAVSNFRKHPKENGKLLAKFLLGAGIGAFLFSTPIAWLLENHELPTMYFFIGAVFGGIPLIERKSKIRKFSLWSALYMLAGAVSVLLISTLPEGIFQGNASWMKLFIAGIAAAIALILPGISFSHFLLILGLYEGMLNAIKNLDVMFLLPLAAGILLGTILFSKMLEFVMNKYPEPTYLIILGFILGSVAQIFPGIPGKMEILVCIGLAAVGFFIVKNLVVHEG